MNSGFGGQRSLRVRLLMQAAIGLGVSGVLAGLVFTAAEPRHDVCKCEDGKELCGYATHFRSTARSCEFICRNDGGGRFTGHFREYPAAR